jgi:hypothetical protein
MGVLGWNVIQDNKRLVGTVIDHGYSDGFFEGDNDWSLSIQPAQGFEDVGEGNDGGIVECEIRTAIDDKGSEEAIFGSLVGQIVDVSGTWVTDISHDNKKEIHPLMFLTCNWGQPPGDSFGKRVKVMVLSDHSPDFMLIPPRPAPPYADQSVHATFGITYPPAPSDDILPVVNIADERNMTDSRNFSISGSDGVFVLNGDIYSGHGDNGGYYRGLLDLQFDTSAEPAYVGLVYPASTASQFVLGYDYDSFFALVLQNFGNNFPMTKFRTYVINNQRVWSATFESISVNSYYETYMTWDEFTAKYNELWENWNLIDVEIHIDNGQRFWTALWHDNKTSSDGWAIGPREYIMGTIVQWGTPFTIKTYLDNGVRVWFAIFRNTGTTMDLQLDLSWQDVLNLQANPDRALLHLEPYVQNSQRLWAAITEQKPNNVALTWWVNKDLFAASVQNLFDTGGWRLFNFSASRGFE